jgi:serine/threonine protein kinase
LRQSNNPTRKPGLPKELFGYEVVDRIGVGAASVIYAVTDPRTSQLFALKHVVRRTDKDIRYVEQMENELNVSKGFRHPALRKSFELKVSRKILLGPVAEAALVMEFVHGAPINEQPPPNVAAVVDCFIQTAHALEAMHRMKLLHCDLKPNNILRDAEGRVRVIDFGQACPFGTVKPRLQGTPDYMAPEQVKLQPLTIRTDVFNFGATLYWALGCQRVPTLYTIGKGERPVLKEQKYPTPTDLNPHVPEKLSVLVMQCLRYRPEERPTNMSEVLHILESYRRQGR